MTSPDAIFQKRYISFPTVEQPRQSRVRRTLHQLLGLAMLPLALGIAALRGTPGIKVRLRCIALGIRSILRGDARRGFMLVANPMDSFRYFELDFVDKAVSHEAPRAYLDVSSPRLVPLMLLRQNRGLVADILNPIESDLSETTRLAAALDLTSRCRTAGQLIEDAAYQEASFDLITSVSVVEHIPNDAGAVWKMWGLLRPGGRLLLTVPCAREACEEFANLDEYGLLTKDPKGFVYWQRYYDRAALTQRIWSVTGTPSRMKIYGEINVGSYDENVVQKRSGLGYPYWWEPVMMGRDYRHYDDFQQLPGMGVVAMEFIKPLDAAHE